MDLSNPVALSRPTTGRVVAVYNSPGPGQNIRFDISIMTVAGATKLLQQKSKNPAPPDYDVWTVPAGYECGIEWSARGPRFDIPFFPMTTDCVL